MITEYILVIIFFSFYTKKDEIPMLYFYALTTKSNERIFHHAKYNTFN